MNAQSAEHWEAVYSQKPESSVSWFQEVPAQSLAILDELGVKPSHSVVDVGAGASRLVDELVRRGFGDVTVLDVAATGLDHARARVGDEIGVEWVVSDVLTWSPARTFDVWHDRAVFHFLTDQGDIQRYVGALERVVAQGGLVLVATFAQDGPTHCSGLPVSRYDPAELHAAFGTGCELLGTWREEHRTPADAVQPFTWVGMRRGDQ